MASIKFAATKCLRAFPVAGHFVFPPTTRPLWLASARFARLATRYSQLCELPAAAAATVISLLQLSRGTLFMEISPGPLPVPAGRPPLALAGAPKPLIAGRLLFAKLELVVLSVCFVANLIRARPTRVDNQARGAVKAGDSSTQKWAILSSIAPACSARRPQPLAFHVGTFSFAYALADALVSSSTRELDSHLRGPVQAQLATPVSRARDPQPA